MSFDRAELADAVARHGRVVRVVVAAVKGSVPREVGASMLVWDDGQSGTIGGGALEFEAATRARGLQRDDLSAHPLGPSLGQCCGGHVTVLSEVYDAARLAEPSGNMIARGPGAMPLKMRKYLADVRSGKTPAAARLIGDWMVEPISTASRPLWIWGAGHVGRALAGVMAPLPEFAITWVDTDASRFPSDPPGGVCILPAASPCDAIGHAPRDAAHMILTYSHALDLSLCHGLLGHGFHAAGLIGSATKWARFRNRLSALGHSPAQIDTITCPIGDPGLGKHPQAIAVGVSAALLGKAARQSLSAHAAGGAA